MYFPRTVHAACVFLEKYAVTVETAARTWTSGKLDGRIPENCACCMRMSREIDTFSIAASEPLGKYDKTDKIRCPPADPLRGGLGTGRFRVFTGYS